MMIRFSYVEVFVLQKNEKIKNIFHVHHNRQTITALHSLLMTVYFLFDDFLISLIVVFQ